MKNKTIRSLHVSDLPEGAGGAEAVFADTIEAARELGHEVSTLVSDGRRSAFSYVFSLRWYRAMRRQLRSFEPDLIHLQNYYHYLSPSILLAIRHHRRTHPDLRVVFTAHDFHLVCPNSGFQHFPGGRPTTFDRESPEIPLFGRFDHRSLAHSALKALSHRLAYRILALQRDIDLIISPSEHLMRTFRNAGVRTRIALMRNPVHNLAANAVTVQHQKDNSVLSLVYLGRVTQEKGLAPFIAALDEIATKQQGPRMRLRVYGDGPAVAALAAQVATLHTVSVEMMGRIPRDQVTQAFQDQDVFVFPSIWPENAPIGVIEAAAAGLPVIVSRNTGASEMARLSSCWAEFDPYDSASVEAALKKVREATSPNQILDMRPFTFEAFVGRLRSLYASV